MCTISFFGLTTIVFRLSYPSLDIDVFDEMSRMRKVDVVVNTVSKRFSIVCSSEIRATNFHEHCAY